MEIRLVVADALKSTLLAAGASAFDARSVPACPLQVGDVIAYPAPHALALQVVARSYSPPDATRPPRWTLQLAQVPHPLD